MKSRLTTIKAITRLIFAEDKAKKADLIIVPGSSQLYLPQEASVVYLKGFSKKILFTGGINPKIGRTESSAGKEAAMKSGVPEENILCEDKSTNTKENAIEAMNLIRKYKIKHDKIILVSKSYTLGGYL